MKYYGKLFGDEDCDEPYIDDKFKMFIFSRKYSFGTMHKYTPEEIRHRFRFKKYVIHPLYAYEHGGLMIGLSRDKYPFNCRWDGYQIGFIVTPAKYKMDIINSILDDYNCWLNGDVWGYTIYDENDEEVESSFNYYGYSVAEQCMNDMIKELEIESDLR